MAACDPRPRVFESWWCSMKVPVPQRLTLGSSTFLGKVYLTNSSPLYFFLRSVSLISSAHAMPLGRILSY